MNEIRTGDSSNPGQRTAFDHVLRVLPDEPRYIEARAMLIRGDAEIIGNESLMHQGLARSQRPDCIVRGMQQPLAVVIGSPAPEFIRESVETSRGEVEVLCHDSQRRSVAAALSEWLAEGARFHLLPAGWTMSDAAPRLGAVLRVLDQRDVHLLASLPQRLRNEMTFALGISPVIAAMIDSHPVSLAYSPAMTERWFDIAIETIQSHQRRGLAELVSRRLITLLMQRGRRPVWGAVDSNVASLALARKLGFVAHDRLALFTRPRVPGRHRRS